MTKNLEKILEAREQRKTVSKLGFDIIITPQNEVKIIEINGANSGCIGLRGLNGRDIDFEIWSFLQKYGLPLYHAGNLENSLNPDFVAGLDKLQLNNDGEMRPRAPMARSKFPFHAYPPSGEKEFKGIILNFLSNDYVFDERKYLVLNPFAVENATVRKDITHSLFDPRWNLRPRTALILKENEENKNDVQEFFSGVEYFILKPVDEFVGRNVFVVPREELYDVSGNPLKSPLSSFRERETTAYHEPNIMMEELIPSKKIICPLGEERFGCMRYIVVVESNHGEMKIHHFGGYWRLAPSSCSIIDKAPIQQKFIANLKLNAIPQFVAAEDFELVRKTIDSFLPVLYRRFLRLPLNERPDGIPLKEYCF